MMGPATYQGQGWMSQSKVFSNVVLRHDYISNY
jgi:hypothetical protein